MSSDRINALVGVAVSADASGLWLREAQGKDTWVQFPDASRYVNWGHLVAVAGEQSDGGYAAQLLENRSTRVVRRTFELQGVSWGESLKRSLAVFPVAIPVLMFVPILNLLVASILGLAAAALALAVGTFWRTLGHVLLWVLFTIGITWLFVSSGVRPGSETGDHAKQVLGVWYVFAFPCTYFVVFASIQRASAITVAQRNHALETAAAEALAKLNSA